MTRRLSILIFSFVAAGSFAVSLSSCNAPSCGPGTVQQQDKNGKLQCVQVDAVSADTHCDVDAGNVMIVGGKCVSAIQCDPSSTTVINGVCVGMGTTNPANSCPKPASGKACIHGAILNFSDNKYASGNIHVQLFEALTLLQGGAPVGMADVDASGGYNFPDISPGLGLFVVVTGNGTTQVATGTGVSGVVGDSIYRADAYTIPKAQADAWGFDYTTGGAQIAKFYKDPKPSPTNLIANEMSAASGVTLMKDGSPAAGAKYFNDTLTAIDPALTTATGASGVAIVASPIAMGGMFPTFSGSGGGVPTWETLPGGSRGMTASTPPFVIITRFHPNM